MATPFLWEPGTSNNGLYASSLTLMTTELNTLTNTSLAASSVGGASGVFTNSNTAQVMYSPLVFAFGGTVTPSANGSLSLWFFESSDGGTTFENTSNTPGRPADAVFSFTNRSYTSSDVVLNNGRLCRVPALKFKLLVLNNTGQSLPSSGNTIALLPIAAQY